MTATFPAHILRAIRNKSMAALYGIAADYDCDLSDVLDIVVAAPFITPSQPASHAPAAQTDGEALSSSLTASPSVDPFPLSRGRYATRAGGEAEVWDKAEDGNPLYPFYGSLPASPDDDAWDETGTNWASPDFDLVRRIGPLPEPQPSVTARAEAAEQAVTAHEPVASSPAGSDAAEISALPSETGKLVEPKGSAAPTSLRDRIVACHADHPDWPAKLIAEHCGTSEDQVRAAASRRKLRLVSWWDYLRAQRGKTTDALKAAAEPVEPVGPTEPPQAPRPPEPPPAARHEPARRPPEHDADGVLHRVKKAPAGRFYLREKTALGKESRFVHQSLVACPTGPGPLMTSDRKWAWYDTMERYRGAVKKWPELASMRKVAAEK